MTDTPQDTGIERMILPSMVGAQPVRTWKEFRDRIAPQGLAVKARDLIGRTFKIIRSRRYQSAYETARDLVYWVVIVTDDGEILNTTLGGEAVCDVLDALHDLNQQYRDAVDANDMVKISDLEELGANALWEFTLAWSDSGQGEGYYYFE